MAEEQKNLYPAGRQPYLEVSLDGWKFHAQAIGWRKNEVLIRYPEQAYGSTTANSLRTSWIDVSRAVRIRRADSIWSNPDDDLAWHQEADKNIAHRTDPWTVYLQYPTPAAGTNASELPDYPDNNPS